MDKTSLGDRMKYYEGLEASRMFMPLLPIVVRLDGRSFSSFTKNLDKPYDSRMIQTMQATTQSLVEETGANIGYTQSDEISLIFANDSLKSEIFFNGKIHKLISVLASSCTIFFYKHGLNYMPGVMAGKSPMFDCRAYQAPNLEEACNALIWREQDATKNSIQSAARTYYSHNLCDNKHTGELQEMLFQKGVNWNDYPAEFKRGTYYARRKFVRAFTDEERARLPEKHPARTDETFCIERTSVMKLDLPPMSGALNKVEVFIHGEPPIFEESNAHGIPEDSEPVQISGSDVI